MTDQIGEKQRRGRGPTKPFPTMTFEDALGLPQSIVEYGVNGEIQRLTLCGKLGRSPSSSTTRALITNSAKYGLTSGGSNAQFLKVTESGRKVVDAELATPELRLNLAIEQFNPFKELYEKLTDQRLPDAAVLEDELGSLGVADADRQMAAEVFTANIRFIHLLQEISGSEYVTSLSQVVDQVPSPSADESPGAEGEPAKVEPAKPSEETIAGSVVAAKEPSVHIDVQIHIDSTASPAQIDQIFASMARHLYRRGS